jgi:hypothetical protein
MDDAARALKVVLSPPILVRDAGELEPAFARAARDGNGGLIFPADAFTLIHRHSAAPRPRGQERVREKIAEMARPFRPAPGTRFPPVRERRDAQAVGLGGLTGPAGRSGRVASMRIKYRIGVMPGPWPSGPGGRDFFWQFVELCEKSETTRSGSPSGCPRRCRCPSP